MYVEQYKKLTLQFYVYVIYLDKLYTYIYIHIQCLWGTELNMYIILADPLPTFTRDLFMMLEK